MHELKIAVAAIFAMEFIHGTQRHRSIRHMLSERPVWMRWLVYFALIISIALFGIFGTQQFIYFQF